MLKRADPTDADKLLGQALEVLKRLGEEQEEVVFDSVVACAPFLRSSQISEASRRELELIEALQVRLPRALEIARSRVQSEGRGRTQRDWDDWNHVALAFYRLQNWRDAEVEAELAAKLGADRPSLMLGIVPLYLLAGKTDKYQGVCAQVLDRWQEWSGGDLGSAASMCALSPKPPGDSEVFMSLMRRAVDEGPHWSINHLRRAHIRVGEHQQVIDAIREPGSWWGDAIHLAIAFHYAGRDTEAKSYLDQVIRSWEQTEPKYANPRMEREVLRHEAERLILGEDESTDAELRQDQAT